jgi:hypothetical protein
MRPGQVFVVYRSAALSLAKSKYALEKEIIFLTFA